MTAVWLPMLVVGLVLVVLSSGGLIFPFGRAWMNTLSNAALAIGTILIIASMIVCVATT